MDTPWKPSGLPEWYRHEFFLIRPLRTRSSYSRSWFCRESGLSILSAPFLLNMLYSTGERSSVRKAPVVMPPTKVSAIGCIISVLSPGKKARGIRPRIVVSVVMRIGRSLDLAADRQASLTPIRSTLTRRLIQSTRTIPLFTTTPISAIIPTSENSVKS